MMRCKGKKAAFDSMDAAKKAAASMANRKAKKGNPIVSFLRAYGCSCGKFHYGSSRQIDWSRVN